MPAISTNDRDIVRHCSNSLILRMIEYESSVLFAGLNSPPEPNFNLLVFAAHFPYIIILQPVIRKFHLIPINDLLLEQAIFIPYTTAMSRILQGSE
ncbi:hypothetical protein D3C76_1104610 [compost metagenome]